ncbi:MAG: hypothetical protein QXH12_01150 [Candidatus Caldarchaeum sp.]|uniref:Uncharacterized protein n=1 Tax=Caldiarchaeum subterraneum TaxID=311458 RepID=A0A7C5LBU4_CALS0
MDYVERFLSVYVNARRDPSDENLLNLLESLLPFSPPGVEWGLEVASLAGVTYMLEGGRLVAVKVSRDEFGPFMQTNVVEIPLSSLPSAALKNIRDVDQFVQKLVKHLSGWVKGMKGESLQKKLVERLLETLGGGVDD